MMAKIGTMVLTMFTIGKVPLHAVYGTYNARLPTIMAHGLNAT
jgi:hypothetical protein